jgi:hypothetical protein
VKLPRGYSPIKAVQAAGLGGHASFRQPPGGSWSGTIINRTSELALVVEELELGWEVRNGTDVYAGPDLEPLLRQAAQKKVRR